MKSDLQILLGVRVTNVRGVRLKDPTEDRVKYHVWFKVKDSNEVKVKDPIEIGV